MKEIIYENASGKRLNLLAENFSLQTGTLFDHAWEYVSNGIRITGFDGVLSEKELLLTISGRNQEEYEEAMDLFMEVTEPDILNGTPGRLFYGESYLQCYIFSGELLEWEYDAGYADKKVVLVTAYPQWITESNYHFDKWEVAVSENNKQYPNRYAYRYANAPTDAYIKNAHFAAAKFKMLIHGPVVNPMLIIGGNRYLANIVLEAGERLEVDGMNGTVRKIFKTGEAEDNFHCRDKEFNIFEPIPAGQSSFEWSGKFAVDITLYAERGEPRWR